MNDEPKVWLRKRPCKGGKVVYHLRWIDTAAHCWKSRKSGTDLKRAQREAAQLEKQLAEGTYAEVRATTWQAFTDEHVGTLAGKSNRDDCRYTLETFGEAFKVPPRGVTFGMVETFVQQLKAKGNAPATCNKRLRHLRHAFRMAVRRGYAARVPTDGWKWERPDRKRHRIASAADERALLDTALKLYGVRVQAFIVAALGTGGRKSELLGLSWDRVDLDGASVTFTETKGKRDRVVPVTADTVVTLRKVLAMTQQDGGPFCTLAGTIRAAWLAIVKAAGVEPITLHDLRRTYCTRLIQAGVPLPTVQRLAGHQNIGTTIDHYNEVADADLRAGVEKLRTWKVG